MWTPSSTQRQIHAGWSRLKDTICSNGVLLFDSMGLEEAAIMHSTGTLSHTEQKGSLVCQQPGVRNLLLGLSVS